MELKSHAAGDVVVLAISGRFDAHEAPLVADWLAHAAQAPPAQIVVEMSGVDFIDSTALARLVRGMKQCREQGGDLRLCCLRQPVRVIFELTRLDKAFEIFAGEEEAVASFS